jgi:hypothetical protein
MRAEPSPSRASLVPASRGVRAPSTVRGGACVELLLAVPFLFIFSVATFDFVRGARTVAGANRAARQVAWSYARHTEDDTYPAPPAAEDTRVTHYYGTTGAITAGTGDEDGGSTAVKDFSGAIHDFLDLFKLGDIGRGLVSFLTGRVDLQVGAVSHEVTIVHFFPGTSVTKVHKVSLLSRPEAKPDDPLGWFDPFQEIWDKITGMFK